jgi:ectoine hydroxylase-related dioxygenase (phytanoyl-CoA dioxygenase family)
MKKYTRKGQSVYYDISPCSFMYRGYGLQLQVALRKGACNAESEFLRDKTIDKEDFDKRAKELLAEFIDDKGVAKLERKVKDYAKRAEKFKREWAKIEAKQAKEKAARDAKMIRQGYTHRLDAWIHPTRGDDYQVQAYAKGAFTKADIRDILKESRVKDDYVITKLTK